MLGQQIADTLVTRNVMTILQEWDPRKRASSKLSFAEGVVSVSGGALDRDSVKLAPAYMFHEEKDILINVLESLIALITLKKDELTANPEFDLTAYYNINNALQGLIYFSDHFHKKFTQLQSVLKKAEKTAKQKRSFKHLISADFQNLTLSTMLFEFDELISTLREAQLQCLTVHSQQQQFQDAIDHPVFTLAQGLEAYIPYTDPELSHFYLNPTVNVLQHTLRMTAAIQGNVRLMTICPSWSHRKNEMVILEGPCAYFRRHYRKNVSAQISFEPVNLSVLMNFNDIDIATHLVPFVQVAIEIAILHDFRNVIFHAPTGCANLLYALGFRVGDAQEPTENDQRQEVLQRFLADETITFDRRYPMRHVDTLDESFIKERELRAFSLSMHRLEEMPVYINVAAQGQAPTPTTWGALLRAKLYLLPKQPLQVLPDFVYLPTVQYTPSFKAIRHREITGTMPLSKMKYETKPPSAELLLSKEALQSMGALHSVVSDKEIESLAMCIKSLRF